MDSDKVCPLRPGECIDVLETTQLPTGVTRVRCAKGWVSEKTGMRPLSDDSAAWCCALRSNHTTMPTAGSGKTILTYAPAATGTSMFPTSTRPAPAAKVRSCSAPPMTSGPCGGGSGARA
jgi:hypothetical protein